MSDPLAEAKPEPYKQSLEDQKEYYKEEFWELPEEERDEIIAKYETAMTEYELKMWEGREEERIARRTNLDKYPKLAEALANRKAKLES